MTTKVAGIAAILALAGTPAFADFTYEQTTKMTGGTMMAMLKMAGGFAKQAREPQVQTTIVQGDRLATIHGSTATIIDIGKETFTNVDFEKKTYSVLTFAEMAKAMEAALQNMKQKTPAASSPTSPSDVSMKVKVDVKDTGQTKTIQGLEAKQTIMSFETETTDLNTGQKAAMLVASDMWYATGVSGYAEIKKFYERMAQKVAWRPGQNLAQAGGPMGDMFKNMAELNVQSAKMEGIPVLQVTRMTPKTGDLTGEKLATMPLPPDQTAEAAANTPTVSDAASSAAKDAAAQAAAGAAADRAGRAAGGLGGLAGGLGGVRRYRPPQEAARATAGAPSAAASRASTGWATGGRSGRGADGDDHRNDIILRFRGSRENERAGGLQKGRERNAEADSEVARILKLLNPASYRPAG